MAIVVAGSLLIAAGASATITPAGEWSPPELPRGAYYESLVLGDDGSAYMFVAGQDRVVRIAADGTSLRGWNIQGRLPTAMAIDQEGNLLIAVEGRIERYTSEGVRLKPWPVKTGKRTISDEIFAMDVAPDGTVYGVDFIGSRILRIASDGRYLGSFGTWGTGHGRFLLPEDVAIGPDGRVYVIEGVSTRVQVFNPAGRFLKQWGSRGTKPGEFWETDSLDVDSAGRVYVADGYLSRVQVFDAYGNYLDQIGSAGSGPGRFRYPTMLATGPDGFLVGDERTNSIQRLAYAEGPHVPQAQIEFGVNRWPVESTPGRRVWLPMSITSFGDVAAEDLKVCPVRDGSESRRILRGLTCRMIGAVAPGGTKKFGFWVTLPSKMRHGKFRHVRFSLRSTNAGGGPIDVTIYAGRDFSWDMD